MGDGKVHPPKRPADYDEAMADLRSRNGNAKRWQLRIERFTNRHPETGGAPWGWYEIRPLGIEVGFWGSERDDLDDEQVSEWNREAIEHDEAQR